MLAAREGDLDEAKSYFKAAADIRPDYSYAPYNLGVALLRSGPENFLAAQHYLADAVRYDPSLSTTGYDYIFDNQLYFIELSLADSVPADWQFVTKAQNSTLGISVFALVLLLWRISYGYAGSTIREKIIERGLSRLGRYGFVVWLLGTGRRFMNFGVPASGGPWMTPMAFLISVPAIVAVVGWSLLWEEGAGKPVMVFTLLYLVTIALLVHHTGHALVAARYSMRVREAPWPAGIVQALFLAAIGGPAIVPVPASIAEDAKSRERETSGVYLAGPFANLLFAFLLYALFLAYDIPLLRLGATLNLALAAVSLVVVPPLDAAMIGKERHRRLLFWMGIVLAGVSVAVFFSNELNCLTSPGGPCWNVSP